MKDFVEYCIGLDSDGNRIYVRHQLLIKTGK